MKKLFRRKGSSPKPQVEQDVAVLIGKMQQQLYSLERKIDALISQPQGRPSFQRFDRHNRFDRGRRGDSFKEKSYTKVICADCGQECEVPFRPSTDRPVYCKECFAGRKGGGSENFSKGHHFDKRRDSENKRPRKKKKPVSRRRKGRA